METPTITEVKFELGKLFITPGAIRELTPKDVFKGLARHVQGDWGEVGEEDWQENDLSLREGFRLLSSYRGSNDQRFWVITEQDRSVTTVLLPEEY